MIVAFDVGKASPALREMLAKVRALNVAPNVCCWENSGKH
jgi:hypothetical protein